MLEVGDIVHFIVDQEPAGVLGAVIKDLIQISEFLAFFASFLGFVGHCELNVYVSKFVCNFSYTVRFRL